MNKAPESRLVHAVGAVRVACTFAVSTASFAVLALASGCSPASPKASDMGGSFTASGTTGSSGASGVTGSASGTTASGTTAGGSGASGAGAAGSSASGATGGADGGPSESTDGGVAAADGGAVDATTAADAADGTPIPVEAGPPRCDPTHAWGAPSGISLTPTASFARFSGVAAGELTIAWTQADGTVYVADRAATTDSFGTGQPVALGSTTLATDRVALSADGQTLIAITADRSVFVGFNRSGVGLGWAALPSSQFTNLGAVTLEGSATLSEPALGADGASLFFLYTPTGSAPVLAESTYDVQSRAWTAGVALPNAELASADATHRRRPTGASSDGLTLFFYDEVAGTERGAWRSTKGAGFDQFVDLASLSEAAPNSACATLYIVPSTDASASAVAQVQ